MHWWNTFSGFSSLLTLQLGEIGVHRYSVDHAHEDRVAVLVDWSRRWETDLVQRLHVGILAGRSEAGQIQPVVLGSALQIVSVVFYGFKRLTTQTGQFQDHVLAFVILTTKNI